MTADDQTAAGQWAALWETYMHENRTLRARAEAAEQRAGAAEAEVARLRAAVAETLRLADIYAGVAAHNAEAEPETAGDAWRSAGAATVRELRRALGGAA